VEIEDGCVEHIQLKEGDSAEAVAIKFCQEHALPEQFVAPLTQHIVSNIISIRCVVTEAFVAAWYCPDASQKSKTVLCLNKPAMQSMSEDIVV
jgi:hypothetical protein